MPPILGQDYLLAWGFLPAIKQAHRLIPRGGCFGVFDSTGKSGRPAATWMIQSGEFSEGVTHLEPFDYSHRYPVTPQVLKRLENSARYYEALAVKHKTKIGLSPFCEHNHTRAVMAPIFRMLRKVAPNCFMVNSIWKGQEVPGTVTEIHLENSKPKPRPRNPEYIVAFDGFGGKGEGDFTDCDIDAILARYKDARQIRGWNFRFNGKFGHKDPTALLNRSKWPNPKYIRGHWEILKGREGAVSWPETALLKPFSDDHGDPEPTKDNRLMCILPEKAPSVQVLDSAGNLIHTMRRMMPDHGNKPQGARYYSTLYAYEVGDLAQRRTNSRLITVRVEVGKKNGKPFFKNYPLTDADLRSGSFR